VNLPALYSSKLYAKSYHTEDKAIGSVNEISKWWKNTSRGCTGPSFTENTKQKKALWFITKAPQQVLRVPVVGYRGCCRGSYSGWVLRGSFGSYAEPLLGSLGTYPESFPAAYPESLPELYPGSFPTSYPDE
jgi:hypothetical protein